MTGAEIYAVVRELTQVICVIAFTFTIIVPAVFWSRTDDESFLEKVNNILQNFIRATLYPLVIAAAAAFLVTWLLFGR